MLKYKCFFYLTQESNFNLPPKNCARFCNKEKILHHFQTCLQTCLKHNKVLSNFLLFKRCKVFASQEGRSKLLDHGYHRRVY